MVKLNDTGPTVKKLQRALAKVGFSPGAMDGVFGLGTEAAVIAFQRSNGLLADGVAGPRTLAKLYTGAKLDSGFGALTGGRGKSPLDKFTVAIVSRMFPFTPLDHLKANLPLVLAALKKFDLNDLPMGLVSLATIRAETESFLPISEAKSRFNTSPGGHPFDLYDFRADLGNQGPPDGERYRGRGFVQLTGKANYKKYGNDLGVKNALVTSPEKANDPKTAAALLALFLKSKERLIKEALLDGNLRTVRRLVNGGSHGLERFVDAYTTGHHLLA